MPLIKYIDKSFRRNSLNLIETINGIIDDYRAQGYTLTLRQVYYQLVSRDIIPNSEKSYNNIGVLINSGRLAGLIDWSGIEDRTRSVRGNAHWDSPADIIGAAIDSYSALLCRMLVREGRADRGGGPDMRRA